MFYVTVTGYGYLPSLYTIASFMYILPGKDSFSINWGVQRGRFHWFSGVWTSIFPLAGRSRGLQRNLDHAQHITAKNVVTRYSSVAKTFCSFFVTCYTVALYVGKEPEGGEVEGGIGRVGGDTFHEAETRKGDWNANLHRDHSSQYKTKLITVEVGSWGVSPFRWILFV